MVGILGGWVVGVLMIGVDPGAFWSQMQNGVDVWNDVLNGVIKSLVFGVTVTLVSLYEGWQAKPTPEGVARPHAPWWWDRWRCWAWISCLRP